MKCCLCLLAGLLFAAQFAYAEVERPLLGAIIIDDIGYNTSSAKRIAEIPFPLTCAVLPEAPASVKAAKILADSGKELMLHLPMQGRADQAQEINVLNTAMTEQEFKQEIRRNLDLIPTIAGLNNHQGSILTRSNHSMIWLMEELSLIDDFYFIDSRTTKGSVAAVTALGHNVPYAIRDVFLDHIRSEAFVTEQLAKFVSIVKEQGIGIAIGHPYRETLNVLELALPELEREGITLVNASELVKHRMAAIKSKNAKLALRATPNTLQ